MPLDRVAVLSSSGLLVSCWYLSSTVKSSFAFDHVFVSCTLVIFTAGLSALLLDRFLSPASRHAANQSTENFQLQPQPLSPGSSTSTLLDSDAVSRGAPRRSWLLVGFFTTLVALRTVIFNVLFDNQQCVRTSFEPCILLALAVYECRRAWRYTPANSSPRTKNPFGYLEQTFVGALGRLFLMVALVSGGMYISSVASEPRSTYICSLDTYSRFGVPGLDFIGTLIDAALALALDRSLIVLRSTAYSSEMRIYRRISWILLSSSIFLAMAGTVFSFSRPPRPPPRRPGPGLLSPRHTGDTLKILFASNSLFVSFLLLSTTRAGLLSTGALLLFACTLSAGWLSFLATPDQFIGSSPLKTLWILVLLSIVLYLSYGPQLVPNSQNPSWVNRVFFSTTKRTVMIPVVIWIIVMISLSIPSPRVTFNHPIPDLMARANEQHDRWAKQARTSKTLAEATRNYRLRYGRHPPPHFDRWYIFATTQSSQVLDDFDSLQRDIAPFWALQPSEIRYRTWQMNSGSRNAMAGLTIRNGTATINSNMPDSHRWMLDVVRNMVHRFSEWIPDMDLAFNINDEPRVAVPHLEMEYLRSVSRPTGKLSELPTRKFSSDRAAGWPAMPEQPIEHGLFEGVSHHNTFDSYGSIVCPPFSRSRSMRVWDISSLCSACRAPHTINTFVEDWPLAASPCHQPDFARLHGLHLSPAAFGGSHQLMPVFSQSKPLGYHDILFPSPWNYAGKSPYAPDAEHEDSIFSQKEDTLFWRGSTSEGFSSRSDTWKGMSRQRLVHLLTNATDNELQVVAVPLKTTSNSSDPLWSFQKLRPTDLRARFNTSVRFVGEIVRCEGRDCHDQYVEFAPDSASQIGFQDHWRFKYLFDADGAGFSGRFRAFLLSRSCVFKAQLMQEWFDSRLTAWKHFVPVDLRLAEVYSLLTYFMGWQEDLSADRESASWVSKPHDAEASAIADAGRDWAGKVLRPADMEIYFFRLLLEWGRLTDDMRDHIGYYDDSESSSS